MIGQTIGNFEVISHLGIGGMGEVWLAEQRSVGTRVAIKLMNAAISQNTQHVQRFFNEARAVSRIQHVGIVKIFDVGEHSGRAYLVMEHLEGETLAQRLARVGRLSFTQIGDIGRQIANVLDATHSVGITHRDLKPDNVFLVPDRELGERVKILDFGIAKLSGTLADVSPQTMGTLGTPAYMAPEQWGDSSKVDWRADLYSLGCVAFEMTCGRPPFVAENIAQACGMHLHEQPPRASTLTPTVPAKLEQLLAQLLAKDPEARPSSVREVARAFDLIGKQALGNAATLPTDAVSLATPIEPAKRSLSMIAISLAVVIVAVGSIAFFVLRKNERVQQITRSDEAAARVVVPRASGSAAATPSAQSPDSTPTPSSTSDAPTKPPSGARDAPTTTAKAETPVAPQPAAPAAKPTPTVPPITQPVTSPTMPPSTPPATQTDKPATPPPTRPVNTPVTSAPPVDAGVSASTKDAGVRPPASAKPKPGESATGSGEKVDSGADTQALQQAVRARSAQTNRCFEIASRDNPSLSGTVTLRIKIDGNGRVTEADAEGMTEKLQTCLIMQVREIKFPKPQAAVSITVPLRFDHE